MRHLMLGSALCALALSNPFVMNADDGSAGAGASGGGDAAAAPAEASKSIVDPKYRGKKNDDFVTALITKHATAFKEKVTKTKVEGSDEEVETKTQVPNGVDVEGLFKLAAVNNIDVAKFREQTESHGFPGRFRMTVANMLRAAARNRHGIFEPGEKAKDDPIWIAASTEWLEASKPAAPKEPTHNPDGSKIKKAKPVTEPAVAPAEGEAATA